jgi:hypothetical protein
MYLFRIAIFIVLLLLPFSVGNLSEAEACRTHFQGSLPVIEEVSGKTLPFQLFRQGLPWHGFEFHQSKQTPHLTKFFAHLAEGNFKYAFNRLWLNAKSLILNLWQQSMLFLFIWLLLTVIAIVFVVQKKRGRKFLYTLMPLGLLLLLVLLGKKDEKNEVLFRNEGLRFKIDSKKPIGISEVRSEIGQIIGHLLWVDQSEVRLDFICCSASLVNQVDSVAKHSFPLALMAASYFDEENNPAGFLSVKGELSNQRFNPDWDGLLIMQSGEMSIGNLQTMKRIGKVCDTDNERKDNPATELFACAVDDPQNILIQLPLLVFDHQLLIDYRKTPYRLREMRFFGLDNRPKE